MKTAMMIVLQGEEGDLEEVVEGEVDTVVEVDTVEEGIKCLDLEVDSSQFSGMLARCPCLKRTST